MRVVVPVVGGAVAAAILDMAGVDAGPNRPIASGAARCRRGTQLPHNAPIMDERTDGDPASPGLGLSAGSRCARVAAVQMVSGKCLEDNLATAGRLIAEAVAQGAGLVVLPEYFCLMGDRDQDKLAIREIVGSGPIQSFLADAAKRYGIWLAGGTLPLASSDPARVYNSLLVYDPHGHQAARYDKIHLFALSLGAESYDEARSIVPGHEPVALQCALAPTRRQGSAVVGAAAVVPTPTAAASASTPHTPISLRLGLSVCYDLRFPELYRCLRMADLILVPAAFTATTGAAHWETLLRARAIENLGYVLAAAQGGQHENGRSTFGHSMLIDPWGSVLARCARGPGVVVGDVDLDRIAACRSSLPALMHKVLPLPAAEPITGGKPS